MAEAIVVGAGVFGAALADRLVTEGWVVRLIDRFGAGDPRAESGGETRLLRFSHGPDAFYTRLAHRSRDLWQELGSGVLEECGVLWLARREDGWEADSLRALREAGIGVERLTPDDGAQRLPGMETGDLAFVLHEPEAGVDLRGQDPSSRHGHRQPRAPAGEGPVHGLGDGEGEHHGDGRGDLAPVGHEEGLRAGNIGGDGARG